MNIIPLIINIFRSYKLRGNKLKISSFCLIKVIRLKKYDVSKFKININDKVYNINFKLKKGIPFIKGFKLNYYYFEIPIEDVKNFDIQNKIVVRYNDHVGRIIYNIFDLKKGKNRYSNVITTDDGLSIFLRQTIKNTMYLTVRETNDYDYKRGKNKIFFGYILSKLVFKKNLILLYEKECSKYEESASIVYEKLIDNGYNNVYYILNRDNIKYDTIDEKYKKNIIFKDSLKHIIYYFRCKKFISTESLSHAMQLRIANKKVRDKELSEKISYVFLQHGVMYMISLNSELRSDFRKKNIKLHKIVVSSKLEADHFVELANYSYDDLYICGLPKFDKAVKHDDADKIIIMPTWRRWEVNEARINYKNTRYFKMIEKIVSSIPKKYLEKLIILPHPLMLNAIRKNNEYEQYIPKGHFSYDELLKDCKVLITDYSSISYDAFYRGSNIIFYWEEKDACLEKYGKGTELMLKDNTAFGDVCYNKEDLNKIIEDNYKNNQNKKYIKRYSKIVEFHDGKNTERLIDFLKRDGVL